MSLGVGSRFSVVVPTRNRPRQLGACLDALARLDYEAGNFEVVVVDDGSGCAIADVVAQRRGPLWQVANAGGFVLEAARQLLDGKRPRPPA